MINKIAPLVLLSLSTGLFAMEQNTLTHLSIERTLKDIEDFMAAEKLKPILPHIFAALPNDMNQKILNHLFENDLEKTTDNIRCIELTNRASRNHINENIESIISRINGSCKTRSFLTALYLNTRQSKEYCFNMLCALSDEERSIFLEVLAHKHALQFPLSERMSKIALTCLMLYRINYVDLSSLGLQKITFLKDDSFFIEFAAKDKKKDGDAPDLDEEFLTRVRTFSKNGTREQSLSFKTKILTSLHCGDRIIIREHPDIQDIVAARKATIFTIPNDYNTIIKKRYAITEEKPVETLDKDFGDSGVLRLKKFMRTPESFIEVIDIFEDDSILFEIFGDRSAGNDHNKQEIGLINDKNEIIFYGNNYIGKSYPVKDWMYIWEKKLKEPSAFFKDSSGTICKSYLLTNLKHVDWLSNEDQAKYDYVLVQEKHTPKGIIQEVYKHPKSSIENLVKNSSDAQ